MARPHLIRRILIRAMLGLFTLVMLLLMAIQIQLHLLRNRAEHLLAEIQSLELRKTTWQEAKQVFNHWNALTKYDPPCTDSRCSFEITINDFYFGHLKYFSRLSHFANNHPMIFSDSGVFDRAYMHLGGRPVRLDLHIGIRDGIVWEKNLVVGIYVLGLDKSTLWDEHILGVTIETKSRLSDFGSSEPGDLVLHHNYTIGQPGGCEGCVYGWVYLTPYADPRDVRRLFQINLSCITSWRSCQTQPDIMPNAWAEHLSDDSRLGNPSSFGPCSMEYLEVIGRDAENIAVVQPVILHSTTPRDSVTFQLIRRLKGVDSWNPGPSGMDLDNLDETARFNGFDSKWRKPGMQLLLAFDEVTAVGRTSADIHTCGLLPFKDSALPFLLRGISQDYAASGTHH
jgi:hypothetical protein